MSVHVANPDSANSSAVKLTLEQQRARHAWVKCAGCSKEYRNIAKGLPALIRMSGLMQVMAFMQQKGGEHELLAAHLREWLHHQLHTGSGFEPCMQFLLGADTHTYQAVTREAYDWLRWTRQMAAARFKPGKEDE